MKLFLITVLLIPVISFSKQLQKPEIYQAAAPTNVPPSEAGHNGPTCYLAFHNPTDASTSAHWAYSTRKAWTSERQNHTIQAPIPAASCTSTICTATEVIDGLSAGVTYYFAAQEIDETSRKAGAWSNEVACTTPPATATSAPTAQVQTDVQTDTQE